MQADNNVATDTFFMVRVLLEKSFSYINTNTVGLRKATVLWISVGAQIVTANQGPDE